ncbi:hypothetical protein ARMSODRAFT_1018300 [Armillaria solidipes]|uniref:Uncharacterized protein n=1 Tax=Armillaria solidipes TaxID=1076256 RepID=A0A2H3BMR4_9AGAR|nr:hypothetical protein ARMSODRAFT_1018300 [Armillaria solidipes]
MDHTGDDSPMNNVTWRTTYASSPDYTMNEYEQRETSDFNQFDDFNYNYEMLGELDEVAPWTEREDRQTVSYPFRLPDFLPDYRIRQHGQYHGPRTSFLMAGGDAPSGSNILPTDPPQPTNEERRQQAIEIAELKLRRLEEKRQELEDEQQAYDTHVSFWQLSDKGKAPAQRPPTPLIPNA